MKTILLLDCAQFYGDQLEIALKKFGVQILRVKTTEPLAKFQTLLKKCEGVVVSGTDFSPGTARTKRMTARLRDTQLSLPFLKYAIAKRKPLFTICHGFQMLTALFGAELKRKPQPEEGIFATTILRADPLFRDLPNVFRAYKWRRWYVQKVSADFIPLAVSTESIDVVRHVKFPFVGVQFHPEVRRKGNQSLLVLRNWLRELSTQRNSPQPKR